MPKILAEVSDINKGSLARNAPTSLQTLSQTLFFHNLILLLFYQTRLNAKLTIADANKKLITNRGI